MIPTAKISLGGRLVDISRWVARTVGGGGGHCKSKSRSDMAAEKRIERAERGRGSGSSDGGGEQEKQRQRRRRRRSAGEEGGGGVGGGRGNLVIRLVGGFFRVIEFGVAGGCRRLPEVGERRGYETQRRR